MPDPNPNSPRVRRQPNSPGKARTPSATSKSSPFTGADAAAAGMMMLATNAIFAGIGAGIGALVGALVPLLIVGVFVGFGAAIAVVMWRFRAT